MGYVYRCLKKNIFSFGDYQLVPIEKKDMLIIKEWRNQQLGILRQTKKLTNEDQNHYYRNVILPSFKEIHPAQIIFSLKLYKELIGYGGIVHISWQNKRGEISFLVNTRRTENNDVYKNDFNAFLYMIKFVAFDEIKLNRIFTETYDIRPFHILLLEKNGFQLEGRLRQHVLISNTYIDSLYHGLLKDNNVKE
jgi:RimJ/RimL family protein N-acetyltransferase